MPENAPEALDSDVPGADVGVPVHARSARRLGVVRVDQMYALEADRSLDCQDRRPQAGLGGDIETGGQQVAGIQALSDRKIH